MTDNLTNRGEAYNTGAEAQMQGEPITANPYPAGTWDADEWVAGWDDAEEDAVRTPKSEC